MEYKRCHHCHKVFSTFRRKKRKPNKYREAGVVYFCPACREPLGADVVEADGSIADSSRFGFDVLSDDQYRVARIASQSLGRFARCPYCQFDVEISNPIAYCAGCHVEYDVLSNEGVVIFDQKKRTPKYAWAKAIASAGGARIGNDSTQ